MSELKPEAGPSNRLQRALLALLALATIAAYARTLANGFVYYDDGLYVFDNVFVRDGFSLAGLAHIFVTGETGTWQPLALLSHMLDCALFGLRPWGHHLTAILLHACNAVLLAHVLRRMTGRFYPSLAVAALFALHPAHVESVAWVSERKDVLSTLFWLLCMLAYDRFQHRKSAWGYVNILAMLALGLMTKPMLVTLPCVLLLLDYWPYNKFTSFQPSAGAFIRVIRKKLSLFALVAASCVVTVIVQRQNEAVVSLSNLPLVDRLGNVAVSYVKYIGILFCPSGLAIDYAHPKSTLTTIQIAASCAVLLLLTAAAVGLRRKAPYALVGWLWYLGTLVPVIGFVQIGEQGMADRYTYVPSIGLAIALVWGLDELLRRANAPSNVWRLVAAVALLLLGVLGVLTWKQTGYWRNTETLWARAATVNPHHERALRNLGEIYIEQGRLDEAERAFNVAVSVNPADARLWQNLGYTNRALGRPDTALGCYEKAHQLDPTNADTAGGLGLCLLILNRDAEGVAVLQDALRMRPWDAEIASNLGVGLCKAGRAAEAVPVLREAVRLHPEVAKLRNNLGIALNLIGNRDEAIAAFREALRIDSGNVEAQRNLAAMGG